MSVRQAKEKIGYRDIFKQKEYMKVICSSMINRFGDSLDMIAFTWLVYAVTGNAIWTTIIYALNQIPTVVLQPFAGTLVEGMRKKKVIVISDIIRGCIVALLVLFYLSDLLNPWILAIFTLIISSVEAFCLPASTAMIPCILEKRYFAFGTSLNATVCRIVELIGMGLAGIIIAAFGIHTAILIDGITFWIAGLIIVFVKDQEVIVEKKNANVEAYLHKLKDGFIYMKTKQVVFNFCILAVIANAVLVPLNSLQSAMAVEMFGVGSELLSVFGIAASAGMAVGTVAFPYLLQKFRPGKIVVVSGMWLGIFYTGMILSRFTYGNSLWSCILCAIVTFGIGASASCAIATLNVQMMKTVEQNYLARASAIFNATAQASCPITSFLISGVLLKVPVSGIFTICGVACICVFAGVGVLKVRLEEDIQNEEATQVSVS